MGARKTGGDAPAAKQERRNSKNTKIALWSVFHRCGRLSLISRGDDVLAAYTAPWAFNAHAPPPRRKPTNDSRVKNVRKKCGPAIRYFIFYLAVRCLFFGRGRSQAGFGRQNLVFARFAVPRGHHLVPQFAKRGCWKRGVAHPCALFRWGAQTRYTGDSKYNVDLSFSALARRAPPRSHPTLVAACPPPPRPFF